MQINFVGTSKNSYDVINSQLWRNLGKFRIMLNNCCKRLKFGICGQIFIRKVKQLSKCAFFSKSGSDDVIVTQIWGNLGKFWRSYNNCRRRLRVGISSQLLFLKAIQMSKHNYSQNWVSMTSLVPKFGEIWGNSGYC